MTLDPKFNKLPKVTDFNKASAVFQQSHEEGFRTLTGEELVSEIKDYIEITGVELAPISSGALDTPSNQEIRTMEVVGVGPWTHPTLPGGSVSMTSVQKGKLFWNKEAWSLRNVVDFTVEAKELQPIAGGALPTITTTGQDYKMSVSGGVNGATFTDPTLPDGQVVLGKDELGLLYYNSATKKWSLENRQVLPRTPTSTSLSETVEGKALDATKGKELNEKKLEKGGFEGSALDLSNHLEVINKFEQKTKEITVVKTNQNLSIYETQLANATLIINNNKATFLKKTVGNTWFGTSSIVNTGEKYIIKYYIKFIKNNYNQSVRLYVASSRNLVQTPNNIIKVMSTDGAHEVEIDSNTLGSGYENIYFMFNNAPAMKENEELEFEVIDFTVNKVGDDVLNLEFIRGTDLKEILRFTDENLKDNKYSLEIFYEELSREKSLNEIKNGTKDIYADVSNINGTTNISPNSSLIERNVQRDYLVYKKNGLGNAWLYTPVFRPSGSNLIIIKGRAEFNRENTVKNLNIYVAEGANVSAGKYIRTSSVIKDNGDFEIKIDPAYYTVYEGFGVNFCIWINNETMESSNSVMTVKFSNLQIYEVVDGVNTVNISGNNVGELLSSVDQQITHIKSTINSDKPVISPNGNRFKLSMSNSGEIFGIPIIPNKIAVFGNSLLLGFDTFGMAASASDKDYYYLFTEYIKSKNTNLIHAKHRAHEFEGLVSENLIIPTIESVFLSKLTGDEDLLTIQLGDNVNTPEKNALFVKSAPILLSELRKKCQRARIVWVGMWYGSPEKYNVIQNACASHGCEFISMEDLKGNASNSYIGALTNRGSKTRTLTNVSNAELISPNVIKVHFSIADKNYVTESFEVSNYTLDMTTLTYTSTFEIISNSGVASHPGDLGFKKIANKMLFELGISEIKEAIK